MATVNLLETRGLSKFYSGLKANEDIDFTLPKGQIRALIGPNGAGKSTFVGMLCGRIPATIGDVFFNGENVTGLPTHKRISLGIAYTFQITSVFGGLSLEENVSLAVGRFHASRGKSHKTKVMEVLDRVGLADRANQIAHNLSYGHQRLLEIAMGLGQEPKLFILDEPTQGLSEEEVNDFIQLIKNLGSETTVLLIEHNMSVVMETADFITVLDSGRKLAEGTPEEIRANESVQAVYLGTSSA